MRRWGPILTLAAGLVVAVVLMVANLAVTPADEQSASSESAPTSAAPSAPAPSAAAPAVTSAPPVVEPPATYAGPATLPGQVGNGGATLAIAVKDGKAIAYLCDGRTAEAWLQGTAAGGKLSLAGTDAGLTGTYTGGTATGTVTAVGRDWTFSLPVVTEPAGLYRAAADVTNARVVGGWIVLADGTQVGTQKLGSTVGPAPRLNVTDRSSVLNGVAVTANRIDGTTL